MKELVTELLREKYIVHDRTVLSTGSNGPAVALGNRMAVPLIDDEGVKQEIFIIRAQNMPSCTRMAARLVQSFISGGKILNRAVPFDWEMAWNFVSHEYEQTFNPQHWLAVYHNGKPVFEKGERHMLFDILEICAARHKGPYEESVPLAEKTLCQTGKNIRIDYEGNVALAVTLEEKQGRMGIILRSPGKTTTFNFTAAAKQGLRLNFAQCLGAAAAFLEGIQIAFMAGMNGEKIKRGLIARHSPEEKYTREAALRLTRLNAEIASLEAAFEVRYRPEKPEFTQLLIEAEKLAQKVLPMTASGGSR
jgi:hypothetical protein